MSPSSFAIVLLAAFLHAAWNAIVKGSADRLLATWAVVAAAAVVNLPLLVAVGLPNAETWPYLVGSVTIHTGYNLALAKAYVHADLAVAYPIARGSAPLLVTLFGALLLDDPTPLAGVVGVVAVSLSLLVLVSNRPVRDATWPAITGLTIAGYTLFDGAGVRANGDSLQYIGLGFVLHASVLTIIVLWRRGPKAMTRAVRIQPVRVLLGEPARPARTCWSCTPR